MKFEVGTTATDTGATFGMFGLELDPPAKALGLGLGREWVYRIGE